MTLDIRTGSLLPGIAVAGLPAAPLPHRLLAPGTLLLAGVAPGTRIDLGRHQQMWGLLPAPDLDRLSGAAEWAGVVGAGGAGFPTARKLASVARTKAPVIVNGSEGESASGKDTVLLLHVPHLVLDGAVASARALGSRQVIVRIPASRSHVIAAVAAAIDERHDKGVRITVNPGDDTFIAGEASAVISSLQGGPALPAPMSKPPTMRTGLRSQSVLLSNVETFARVAVAIRGHRASSSLLTVSGAVTDPGVLEVDPATPLGEVLAMAGADTDLAAVITGGWHGTWLPADTLTLHMPTNRSDLKARGAHWGAGAFVAIPHDPCPVNVLTAITDHLVGEGAKQCGPCILGLEAARQDLHTGRAVEDRVRGRGLCAHPTATITALRSGQALLAEELAAHAQGRCTKGGWL
ncbi:MAG: SLBB domain-containing protein [Actinobacteria bacterium]|nr:SLBB domain-containing protein [Actinomycetota bacterium]MCB8997276.1 SLBB domain-containing protein [Actinomycetota bacterium]MCB9423586.1 SLBB domain-containing protein [Actinomycetota bacterium]HRY10528.1 SLBB domain-containing protein [Candidatus Nanopelagicales bacterium]